MNVSLTRCGQTLVRPLRGIVSVVQTPFAKDGALDLVSLRRLAEDAIAADVDGFLAPVGPKYTAVREAFGRDFFIAGGWAVLQFIEALDRGVDAMIPESAMVRVYKRIQTLYDAGDRSAAEAVFRRVLPVLAFTNQDVGNSIAFFKRLLVRKGICRTATMRLPDPGWDAISERTADALIDLYLKLEGEGECS